MNLGSTTYYLPETISAHTAGAMLVSLLSLAFNEYRIKEATNGKNQRQTTEKGACACTHQNSWGKENPSARTLPFDTGLIFRD